MPLTDEGEERLVKKGGGQMSGDPYDSTIGEESPLPRGAPLTEEEMEALKEVKVTPGEYRRQRQAELQGVALLRENLGGPLPSESPSEPRVAVFGQEDFHTHLFPAEQVVMLEQLALFQRELKRLLDEMWETYEEKGALYDQQTPVWHHFPLGLASYATEIFIKATRFVSLLQMAQKDNRGVPLGEIEDTLRDVVVFGWYSWAYARRYSAGLAEGE